MNNANASGSIRHRGRRQPELATFVARSSPEEIHVSTMSRLTQKRAATSATAKAGPGEESF